MSTVEERKQAAADKAAEKRTRQALAAAVKAKAAAKPPVLPPDDDGLSLGVAEATLRHEREALASLVTKRSLADDATATLSEERGRISYY